MKNDSYSVDFVITWVDGNDPEWQKEMQRYKGSIGDTRARRYREWGTLPYWFRGVEKCAPWVNKVFFITCGHLPKWLNVNHPKLEVINHSDYIPAQWLPTFSSRPIDMNFHRIKGLSEHFVYFNDDMFLLRPVQKKDFFENGLPCDAAIQDVVVPKGDDGNGGQLREDILFTPVFYDTVVLNRHFDKKKVIKENRGKWFTPKYKRQLAKNFFLNSWNYFTGFHTTHLPYSYLKDTYRELWEKEAEVLSRACEHKFRTGTDVNHFIFSYWQFAKGTFTPRDLSIGGLMNILNDEKKNQLLYDTIRLQKKSILCVNDRYSGDNYEEVNKCLMSSFESVFPEKSSFEL